VQLASDLERIAAAAAAHADGARVVAVLAAEPATGARRYLCAFESDSETRTWIGLDDAGAVIGERREVRDLVAITALCEIAEEMAFPGDLDELRSELVALRLTENPDGIDEAEAAALGLQHAIGTPPQLATPARLDLIGSAARRLERALDPTVASPFAAAMQAAQETVDALVRDVEAGYRVPLNA
jgi:hypothetical protein